MSLLQSSQTVNPFEAGKFITLRGKHPDGNWRTAPPLTLEDIEVQINAGLNIGFAPNPGFVIVDLDIKGGGDLEALIDECTAKGYLPNREILNTTWHQDTASGGRHYMLAVPPGIEVPQRINLDRTLQYGQIDLRVGGKGYIVVAPSDGYYCPWSLNEEWPVTVTASRELLEAAGATVQTTNDSFDLGEPSEHLRCASSILDELDDEQVLELCHKLLQLQPVPHVGKGLRDMWRNTAWALQDIAKLRPSIAAELADLWIEWSLTGTGAPDRRTLEREWQRLDRVPPSGKPQIGAGSLLRQVTPEILNAITKPRKQQKSKVSNRSTLHDRAFSCLIENNELIFFNSKYGAMVCHKNDKHANSAMHVTSSRAFNAYLQVLKTHGLDNVSIPQLKNVADKIRCIVEASYPNYNITLRSYHDGNASYMLVGTDERSQVLEVNSAGYRFVQTDKCFFKLGPQTAPLIEPLPGDPTALNRLLNLFMLDGRSKSLLVAWMLSTLRGAPPHPVCVLYGGAGAAKSTLARVIRRLIDPQRGEQLTFVQMKRFNETVYLLAEHDYIIVLDNAGRLDNEQLDELCVISTGGTIKKRALYTNNDMHANIYNNPVLITTVNQTIGRSDAMSRCIIVEMDTIPPTKRVPLDVLNAQVDQLLPYAFENLLRLMVRGYQNIATIQQRQQVNGGPLPRLAEYVLWGEACGIANLRNITEQQQGQQQKELIAQNPIIQAVIKLVDEKGSIDLSISQLHRILKKYIGRVIPADKFPPNSTHLGRALRQNQAALVAIGYEVRFNRTALARVCSIRKTDHVVPLDDDRGDDETND